MTDAPKPYTLHYAPTPNGKKITIFFEEAHIPYKIKKVDLGKGDQFKPAFLKISPNNKMPALVDPNGPGGESFSVFESGAILQYLGRKHGAFYPLTEAARSRVEQWLFFQMASLGPMSGQAYYWRKLNSKKPKEAKHGLERYTKEVQRLYGVMDTYLKKRDSFGDQLSIADFAIYPWIFPRLPGEEEWESYTHLRAWYAKMGERPGVQRGMAIGEDKAKKPKS
jgi:GST-like protein